MSDRALFPNLKLFKKTLREHFLVAIREIYKVHPTYTFLESRSDTQIHIEPTYADVTYTGKKPHMLVKIGTYDFALQDTLGKNMFEDVPNLLGVTGGYSSLKNMSTNIFVIVRAYAEEESSDLADELAMLGVYAAHHMFTQVGINIQGSRVGETNKTETQGETYDTVVNFQVDVPWKLQQVNEADFSDPEVGIDLPTETADVYRSPNVYINDDN